PGMIAFASSFPGSIRAVEITPDWPIVVQKSGFLATEQGVEMSVFFQKKAGAGFFGGEGFFNTVVTGPGRIVLQTMPVSGV
ncbi:AIM24 family protein, partial [Pseudomonas syringae pv. tagetis]|uniref:AIM24 family protein n=1 Tax=Pseudomonas syringae group genomosp. 7 TaxID=251699 RepID=UPI00376FBAC4